MNIGVTNPLDRREHLSCLSESHVSRNNLCISYNMLSVMEPKIGGRTYPFWMMSQYIGTT